MTERQLIRMRSLEIEYDAITKRRAEIYAELNPLQLMYHKENGFVTNPAKLRGLHNLYNRNMAVLKPLGRILREARRSRSLTQTEVGELLGVGTSSVCFYEVGRIPPPKEKYIIHFPELKGAKEWKLIETVRGRH